MMTFAVNLVLGFSIILIVSAVQGVSMQCAFTYVLSGAKGKPNCPGISTQNTTGTTTSVPKGSTT